MPIVKTPTFPDKVTDKEIIIGIEARGSIKKLRTYQITTVTKDGDMKNRVRSATKRLLRTDCPGHSGPTGLPAKLYRWNDGLERPGH